MRLEIKYLAVKSLNEERDYPIANLYDILELNRSSYYKWLRRFDDYVSLKAAIEEYIVFYNNNRYQAGLGGLAPLELREVLLAA